MKVGRLRCRRGELGRAVGDRDEIGGEWAKEVKKGKNRAKKRSKRVKKG